MDVFALRRRWTQRRAKRYRAPSSARRCRAEAAMATQTETIHHICGQAGLGAALTWRKMFGEFALYLDGKVVALVCDDQLFVKPTDAGRALLGEVTLAPPYPGAKDYLLLDRELDDPERLRAVLRATAAALPTPTPRKAKPKKEGRPDPSRRPPRG